MIVHHIMRRRFEEVFQSYWSSIPRGYKKAAAAILVVNIAAFGFEATNLTFHHDDISQFFRRDGQIGHALGRFGYSWLHNYVSANYYLPFLSIFLAVTSMTLYSLLIASVWRLRSSIEIFLVGAIVTSYPYVAQIYQYDTAAFPFAFAHFLTSLAVYLSLSDGFRMKFASSVTYCLAFSIYQSMVCNAVTIVGILIICHWCERTQKGIPEIENLKFAATRIIPIFAGGVIYLIFVKFGGFEISEYQNAQGAFSLSDGFDFAHSALTTLHETKNSLLWPENYFPLALKHIQLLFLVFALWALFVFPITVRSRIVVFGILFVSVLGPRSLQFLHPDGDFHNLTVTSYGVLVAGWLRIGLLYKKEFVRNLLILLSFTLLFGYVREDNWMSTVAALNWEAQKGVMVRVIAAAGAKGQSDWDGKNISILGKYDTSNDLPYKPQTGVGTVFITGYHFSNFSKIMRQELNVISANELDSKSVEAFGAMAAWPNPNSIKIVEGIALVKFSEPLVKNKGPKDIEHL